MRVLLPLAHNNNDDEGEEEQEGIEVFLPDDFQITESTEQAIRLAVLAAKAKQSVIEAAAADEDAKLPSTPSLDRKRAASRTESPARSIKPCIAAKKPPPPQAQPTEGCKMTAPKFLEEEEEEERHDEVLENEPPSVAAAAAAPRHFAAAAGDEDDPALLPNEHAYAQALKKIFRLALGLVVETVVI